MDTNTTAREKLKIIWDGTEDGTWTDLRQNKSGILNGIKFDQGEDQGLLSWA